MCGYAQPEPLHQTTEAPPRRRARAETLPKGSLAQTIDIESVGTAERTLAGFLAVYVGRQPAGVFWPIYSGETLLGRAGGGAQAEVALNAPSVSARHASIFCSPSTGLYTLVDHNSRNGTEHNGHKLRPGETKALQDDDQIKLGLVTVVVKLLPR